MYKSTSVHPTQRHPLKTHTHRPHAQATERAAEHLVSVSRLRVLFTEELLKRGVESAPGEVLPLFSHATRQLG